MGQSLKVLSLRKSEIRNALTKAFYPVHPLKNDLRFIPNSF